MNALLKDNKLVIEDHLNFYKDIIDSVNGSVHIVKIDKNGNTLPVWMNKHYSRIMGYSFSDRQKMGLNYKNDELYHPDDLDVIRAGAKKLIENREEGHTGMFRIRTKENDWKWVLLSCKSIKINGDSGFLLCFMVDVNETMTDYQFLTEKYTKEISNYKTK